MLWSYLHVKARSLGGTQDTVFEIGVGHGYLAAVTGSTWLLQGLCGCYGVYVLLLAWLLQGGFTCRCYHSIILMILALAMKPRLKMEKKKTQKINQISSSINI